MIFITEVWSGLCELTTYQLLNEQVAYKRGVDEQVAYKRGVAGPKKMAIGINYCQNGRLAKA